MTRVLIIDDDLEMRDQIATALLASYYETYTAMDGRDGVRKALAAPPDLIVCDMMMPNMNGQEVLAELRQHSETASVPFIFLTAVDSRTTVRESMNLGADDYLYKPFQIDDLLNSVSARLKLRQQIAATTEQQLDILKLRLARMITHELRTPLGFIVTSLDLLKMEDQNLTSDDSRELIDTMSRGAKRLSHCVEQMVYATHLTTGVLTAETVANSSFATPVSEVVKNAVSAAKQFTVRHAEKVEVKLTADSEDDLVVKCDQGALKEALGELISNALAFSPANGNVRISYRRIQDDVRITITDHGPGIPDESLKEAFEWFSQVDRETQEQQGMGLGLPLANQLIAAHNGSLELRSIVGKGTRAIVLLPAA